MCISAEVSFGLSGLLLVSGACCVSKAWHRSRRLLPLAVVPLAFSVQQFCEGWVWIGVGWSDPQLAKAFALCFLFFALVFWPIWIPLSALLMESRPRVKAWLRGVTLGGAILGGCVFLPILARSQLLTVEVAHHSLRYDISIANKFDAMASPFWEIAYLALVTLPLFVSPVWRAFHLGLAVVLSAAVSRFFFPSVLASVWCLFAAGISLYLSMLFFLLPRIPFIPPAPADPQGAPRPS